MVAAPPGGPAAEVVADDGDAAARSPLSAPFAIDDARLEAGAARGDVDDGAMSSIDLGPS